MAAAVLDDLKQRGISVTQLALDSRKVQPGDVFLALPGAQVDGRRFIADALARGAAAVIAESGANSAEIIGAGGTAQTGSAANMGMAPVLEVADLALHAGEIAHLVYGRPSEQLWMCGVTGTNGKTSVSQWVAQAMNAFDCKCGVIGTLGNGFFPDLDTSPNTTPDAVTLHATLARFVREGAVACAMEVSSIGLDQGRSGGVKFDAAVFTNLTRDHLEYHGSMAAYGAAKAKLFDHAACAVLNLDDPFGVELAASLAERVRTIGYTLADARGTDTLLRVTDLTESGAGIAFTLDGVRFAAPVVGRFNASNLLAVIGALLAGDETLEDIASVLPRITPPAGRMQLVGGENAPLVVVDYAHSPDALEKVLTTLRGTATARGGRLVCVFGCGGDRDAGKRPLMGAVAERLADSVVITSDNPRSEDPHAIIAAIRGGMNAVPSIEPDRASAIVQSIASADAHDVILLAGKGHEPYQEIAGIRLSFSDFSTATSALATRNRTKPC